MTSIESAKVKLNNGVDMPWLGLGVYNSQEGGEVENAIECALEAGYRSIDTAVLYMNERGVGNAIRGTEVPRSEIFLTTKILNSDQNQ